MISEPQNGVFMDSDELIARSLHDWLSGLGYRCDVLEDGYRTSSHSATKYQWVVKFQHPIYDGRGGRTPKRHRTTARLTCNQILTLYYRTGGRKRRALHAEYSDPVAFGKIRDKILQLLGEPQ